MANEWLENEHPTYEANKAAWKRDERRLYGGDAVLTELRHFLWEEENGDHYQERQNEATYVNLPAQFADTVVGHLFREAPRPGEELNFGGLGEVGKTDGEGVPDRAEQLWKNADGVGNDASQWDNFWFGLAKRGMATGHRWILAEAPQEAPDSRQDELDGQRPYLVEYSPLAVTDWHYANGSLQYAIIPVEERRPRLDGNELKGAEPEKVYLFLTREGWDGHGEEFQGGGWWKFDEDKELVEDAHGSWEKTGGQIPLFPLFYERSQGTDDRAAMSRSGTMELGQIAVSLMNLNSAADFDTWEAAASLIYLLGVDKEGYELAVEKRKDGSGMIPVPPHADTHEVPEIHDGSTGAVTAETFKTRVQALLELAERIAVMEQTSTPDSSGASKRAGFADVKAPRLAQMASELEDAQNTALHFLEMRWGVDQPSAEVTWTREFDLLPLVEDIQEMFDLEEAAGLRSAIIGARGLTQAAREKGIVSEEDELDAVEAEYRAAAEDRTLSRDRRLAEEEEVRAALDGASPAEGEGIAEPAAS